MRFQRLARMEGLSRAGATDARLDACHLNRAVLRLRRLHGAPYAFVQYRYTSAMLLCCHGAWTLALYGHEHATGDGRASDNGDDGRDGSRYQ